MKINCFKIVKKITTLTLILAILWSEVRIPEKVKADIDFNGELFSKPSTVYNNNLAYFAAELCDKAQGKSSAKVEKFLEKNGFKKEPSNYNKGKNVKSDLLSESASFVIGHKKVNIAGEGDVTVLVVIVRGSTTLTEFIGDAAKESKVKKMLKKGKSIIDSIMTGKSWDKFVKEFDDAGKYKLIGKEVWHNVYDFEEKVWKGLDEYLDANPEVEKDKNLKILVTGHSLGGATANMIAARMDYLRNRGEWIDTVKKKNIYCYTFGAIKVLTQNVNIEDKYENIFNIYNKYDSFGPDGNMKSTNASHPKAKFGITLEYDSLKAKEKGFSWNNHDMGHNYKKAVEIGLVEKVAKKMGLVLSDDTSTSKDESNTIKDKTNINENEAEIKSIYVGRFKEGLARTDCGYISKEGKLVIPIKAYYLGEFSEGLARIRISNGGKYGFINKEGKEVIPLKYDEVGDFSEGLAKVWINHKCGYINKQGEEVVPLEYDWGNDFSEGLAAVCKGRYFGYIDKEGKEVLPLKYGITTRFSEDLATVSKDEKYGYMNRKGEEVIKLKYFHAQDFSEGLAVVRGEGYMCGVIDKKGKEVSPFKYGNIQNFSEGLAVVERPHNSRSCNYINKKGKELLKLDCDSAKDFSEGLGAVSIGAKCGFINKKGKVVIPLRYDGISSFSEGLAMVCINEKWGVINKEGRVVIPFKYDSYYKGGLD